MTKSHWGFAVFVVAIALATFSAGCGGGSSMVPSSNHTSPGVATAITITPGSAAVAAGGTVQFSAMAGGMPTSSVTWSVSGTAGDPSAVGTISSGGLYTAPQVSTAMLVSVRATLTSGTGPSAVASVAILVPGTVSATHNPQVAAYSFTVPESSSVHLEFGPDTNYGLQTWSQSTPSSGGQVKILVAGMRAFTTYHMRAVVAFPDGSEFSDTDHTFATGGLSPSQTPSMTATTTPGMTPNGGVELLNLVGSTGPQENVVATDLNGHVIWYLDPGNTTGVVNPVKPLPDGNMLINYSGPIGADGVNSLLEEVDLAGDVIWQMSAADLNAALAAAHYNITVVGTHHDVAALPNGHLILIASMDKDFTDLAGYPGTTTVTGDVLIDLDQNHTPVWVWSEFDHLDVNRHPMNFPDWTHTNAVLYSASDGDLIISVRHQHWLIKIDYADGQGSGDIVWKLGWQGDFTLQGGTDPVDWFYAQHGPSFLGTNTSGVFQLVLFDNGDNRPNNGVPCGSVPTSPCYSRVPLFQIDEAGKTATIIWQDTLPVFSFFGGNAQGLANGDVEFDEAASGGATVAGAVYEVTRNSGAPQTVWQLQIAGQYAYRAFRIPSLYPGVQW